MSEDEKKKYFKHYCLLFLKVLKNNKEQIRELDLKNKELDNAQKLALQTKKILNGGGGRKKKRTLRKKKKNKKKKSLRSRRLQRKKKSI